MAKTKAGAAGGEPSKREMVKTALDALGNVGPTELQDHIKEKYGVEIPKAIISSYKSQLKAKPGSGGGRGAGRVGGQVDMRDLSAVRDLIRRVGAPQLKALVNMLS